MTVDVAQGLEVLAASNGKAGPIALFVVVLLCLASVLLFRSMSRHLGRVPVDFENDPRDDPYEGDLPGEGESGTRQ